MTAAAAMLLTKPHFSVFSSLLLSTRLSSPVPGLNPGKPSATPRRRLHIVATSATAPTAEATALSRVNVLSEALPFIQLFKGKTVVVKYGGAVMKSPHL
ncbi:hypothetical protein ABZP36_004364 [Zizania latifolia]